MAIFGNKNVGFGLIKNDVTSFITKWVVANNDTISLPLANGYSYDFTVDWGDGSNDTNITSYNDINNTHTYVAAGTYTVKISGIIGAFVSNSYTDRNKIFEVIQWGTNIWYALNFKGCQNLNITALDIPIFGTNATIQRLFAENGAMTINNLENWDVSKVINFAESFQLCSFSNDLSNWDVGNGLNFSSMFYQSGGFNSAIGNWNMSKATNLGRMFYGSTSFNQPLNNWDVSKVTTMYQMFLDARVFNQPLNNWNTASVKDISYMFFLSDAFNQDISDWNISQVTDARVMFTTSYFNSDNYDLLLIGWQSQTHKSNVIFSAGSAKYTLNSPSNTARNNLINDGWVITDGGYRFLENYNAIRNSGFDTDTEWNYDSSWSISGGLFIDNGGGRAYQSLPSYLTGRTFRIKYDIVSLISGSVRIDCGNGTLGTPRTQIGHYEEDLVFSGAGYNLYINQVGRTFNGSVDNVQAILLPQ
ncbi:BspA family leucine-rich repeat surface protein [Lutibacter maritimus]|uniref:Surface protein n=1 Tax=Lutibacter maritimus TaxID=593133 RepID=A0A1I6NSM4_9FLAO|nr:BspA family leucine-rich repeat surface protein [Lutibacter maritimus]SFS30859.1 surface protein [Lutibacter maritimus]